MKSRWTFMLVVPLLAVALLLGACSDDDDDDDTESTATATATEEATEEATAEATEEATEEAPEEATEAASAEPNAVTVTATDFAFAAEGLVPGANTITLSNESETQVHHLQLARIDGDHTLEELLTDLAATEEGGAFPTYAIFDGGVGQLAPGMSGETYANLEAGTYALLCFVPDPADGLPHFAKGMASFVEVSGDENTAELPTATTTINAVDYDFEGVDGLTGGEVVIELTNGGAEPHEANILQLAEGATADDVIAFLTAEEPAEGPPPFAPVGGLQAILPGGSTTVPLNLATGSYALVCFVPNGEGVPHIALGMITEFSIE